MLDNEGSNVSQRYSSGNIQRYTLSRSTRKWYVLLTLQGCCSCSNRVGDCAQRFPNAWVGSQPLRCVFRHPGFTVSVIRVATLPSSTGRGSVANHNRSMIETGRLLRVVDDRSKDHNRTGYVSTNYVRVDRCIRRWLRVELS